MPNREPTSVMEGSLTHMCTCARTRAGPCDLQWHDPLQPGPLRHSRQRRANLGGPVPRRHGRVCIRCARPHMLLLKHAGARPTGVCAPLGPPCVSCTSRSCLSCPASLTQTADTHEWAHPQTQAPCARRSSHMFTHMFTHQFTRTHYTRH